MYEAFYGFKEKPFSMLPDPGFLYLSKKHQAALTLLEYGLLNHVGFCIISGEPGAGKTTILRALLERIEDDVTVGLITNTHQSFGGLLDWVLSVFDLHRPNLTHVEMHQIFMEYLIEEYANGRTVLLIVDEAQNMQPDALEELRMLSNVNTEKDQLMQVVLAGQPALRETLRLPDLMQFAQRIAVDYHLAPLGLEETCGYIQHRLITAGAQKDIFTPAACERLHNYSGGTPRLINLLCETVLVYGFADQQDLIDVDLVDEMVQERMKDSVVPIVNRDIARQDNTQASKELEKDFPWIQPKDGSEGLKPREENSQVVEQTETPVVADVAEKTETAVDDQKEKKTPGKEESIAKAPSAQAGQPASADVKSDAGSAIVSRIEETEKKNFVKGEDGTRKQLIQYSAIAAALAVALIIFALLLGGEEGPAIKQVATDKLVEEDLLQKREQEEKAKERLLRQLQVEAETLKKERDTAIAKAEEERRISLEAEKQSAAKAALAAEEAAEKRRLEEKKRIDAAKKRERKAKQAEAKAREEVKRAKRESAKLAEQRRVMQIRLDEERQLKKLEEARRLELELQEVQRLQLQAAEASAAEASAAEKAAAEKAAEAAEKAKAKSSGCSGPTARFKANCR